jgi:hypothetical protein
MSESARTGKGNFDSDGIIASLGRGISSVTMAIAELIDNAIAAAPSLPGEVQQRTVQVLIRFKQDEAGLMSLVMRDTAAGMSPEVVSEKLFNYAKANPNSTSLNEFGVGAKEALGFLAGADGHFTLKTVWFDPSTNKRVVTTISKTTLRNIYPEFTYETRDAESDEEVGTQWTVFAVKGGFTPMDQQSMFDRILGSVYRKPIREGRLILKGEDSLGNPYTVNYSEPELLKAHIVHSNNKPDFKVDPIVWRVDFEDVDVVVPMGVGAEQTTLKVSGWLGLRAQMTDVTGISIIRRDRLVQMGGRLDWTPRPLFKNAGSPRDKRLVGEIICDEIPTNKTKSDVNEIVAAPLAKALMLKLQSLDPNILSQADHFRIRDYDQALRIHANGGVVEPSVGRPLTGTGTAAEPPTPPSGPRAGLAGSSDDMPVRFGSFTSPVDSRTFDVLLASRQKSGSSTEWEWTKNSSELTISVSPLVLRVARTDVHDERLVPYISLIVALALVDREGQDSDKVIEKVARLARMLKPE